MPIALQKTLALLLLIGIGFLLRGKLREQRQLAGVKLLILSVALPATIFVALLKIQIAPGLWMLPVLALAFNLFLMAATRLYLPVAGIAPHTPVARTFLLLAPSLAPGLSCFPYVLEYLGETPLAWAAIADVGNKVFVLVGLYLLALRWHSRQASPADPAHEGGRRLAMLLRSLASEPVNIVILVALALVAVGWRLDAMPLFVQDAVARLSGVMTPLVLLFIGLAVRIDWWKARAILGMLLWRAGSSLVAVAGVLFVVPLPTLEARLLAVLFALSACSFWPYAHMCAIDALESGTEPAARTTDTELALGVLALSLPLSTGLILIVCSTGAFFAQPVHTLAAGGVLLAAAAMTQVFRQAVLAGKPKEQAIEPVSA